MALKIGDTLPQATLAVMTEDGPDAVNIADICKGKKVAFVGVPGAFTPSCHGNHLPGFLEHLSDIKAKGIDEVAVISVNDVFVMGQWAKDTGGEGKIHFLSDGIADFTKAIGLDIDLSDHGLGIRSKRYSMIVDDGKVIALNVEDSPPDVGVSSAATLLGQL